MTTTTINGTTYHVTPGDPMPEIERLGFDGIVYWLRSAGQRVKAFRRLCGEFRIVY